MEKSFKKNIVPEQCEGKAITATSTIQLSSGQEAKAFFEEVKRRLQDVNNWHTLAGGLSANFKLISKDGKTEQSVPKEGHYLKIDIPGPGSKAGHGYDWVRIEAIEDTMATDSDKYGFTVRPASNPNEQSNDEVAHFYSPESTSTFLVVRDGSRVSAQVLDRNTKLNEVENTTDQVRNKLVGAAGLNGFSKMQWQLLADGLLSHEL